MIKANELRIGNLIDFEGMSCKVCEIDKQGVVVDIEKTNENEWIDLFQFNPISLTEEWLLKLGFEKPAHSWNGDIFHLTEWDEFPLNWAVAMNKNGAMLVLKLKYVHQLQNLYFTLTGEELTIKL
jgi:hypothetical protein